MYRVVFEKKAPLQIRKYIQNYKTYFRKLYEDTGLWNEDMIIDGYIQKGEKIATGMMDLLVERFSSDKVLGRTSDITHIILFENKVLIVMYYEDTEKRIRYIEDLIIAERR